MKYISTRNSSKDFNFSEVFLKGLADDGGLFIPKKVLKLSNEELKKFSNLSYQDLAKDYSDTNFNMGSYFDGFYPQKNLTIF